MKIGRNVVLQFPYSETRKLNKNDVMLRKAEDGVNHNNITYENMEEKRGSLLAEGDRTWGLTHPHFSQDLFGSEAWHYLLSPSLEISVASEFDPAHVRLHLHDFGVYSNLSFPGESDRLYFKSLMHVIPLDQFSVDLKPHEKENYNASGLEQIGDREFIQPAAGGGIRIKALDYEPTLSYPLLGDVEMLEQQEDC